MFYWTTAKKFEYRINDRPYQVGDKLILEEFNPEKNEYTGRVVVRKITYILGGEMFGLPFGMCIMSIEPC